MLPSIKYQYTPGRAESGGERNPARSLSTGPVVCPHPGLINDITANIVAASSLAIDTVFMIF
jgi:hypothetical protein